MRAVTSGRAAARLATPPASEESSNEQRDRLVMEHIGLVKTLAQRLAQRLPSQVELSDLVSVGVLGLIDAAARYKPTLGVPFDAFARRRVQGAMLDSLRDLDWAPRSLRRLRRDVDQAIGSARRRIQQAVSRRCWWACRHRPDSSSTHASEPPSACEGLP